MISDALDLGPELVQALLPHRRPFLMVDRIDAYTPGPEATLRASRCITANEPVFDGHFPDLALWPGVYTIEGLGQSCALVGGLVGLERAAVARGMSLGDALAALRNLDLGFRLHPGHRVAGREAAIALLADAQAMLVVSAAVNVKLLHPVHAGVTLSYLVRIGRSLGETWQFDVEASAGGRVVAKGTMTTALLAAPPRLGAR